MTTQWMKTFVLILSIGVGLLLFSTGCDRDDDNFPSYDVELPEGAHSDAANLKFTALSASERAELEKQGFQFVGTPIGMTLGDHEHVFLQEAATISFAIPSDISPEEYDNLIGVVFHKGQPTYMALDPVQLQEGKAVFKTAHFSEARLMLKSDKEMLNLLLPRIAAGGYQRSMRDADLKKTARERLAADMDKYGLSDNYLLGRVLGKLIEENEFTSELVELINSKDPVAHTTERVTDIAAEKALEQLFAAYQEKYKKNSADAEASDLAAMLSEHLTTDNAKEWAKKLGGGTSPSKLAKEYAKNFAKSALKEFATEMFPIIEVIQVEAKVIEVLKDFWVDNITEESFQAYKKLSPDSNGRISDEDWNSLAGTYMAAVIRQYRINGKMTEAQIREMFEQRIKDRYALSAEESKLRKQFDIWEQNLLFHRGNTRFTYDMDLSVRISILHNLTERFCKEFVVNGKIPRSNGSTLGTEEILADMVYHYLNFFPETHKFYEWAREQGYYGDRLQRDLAALNREGAWFFVRVDIEKGKDEGQNDADFYWSTHEASEGHHVLKTGSKYVGTYGTPIQSATFEAICTFPPKKILQKGQVVILHSIIKTEDTSDYYWGASANVSFDGRIWATEENLKGSMLIFSNKGGVKRGECDFKLVMPSGSKGRLGSIIFGGCGSRTHWVYEWRGLLE